MYDLKSPYELFFNEKPMLSHLRAYGCKAFALTTDTLAKRRRLERLSPKAWIGFLVGYSSSNLYRVWLPTRNKVIVMRDVHFNEESLFDGRIESLRQNVKVMAPDLLAEVLERAADPETIDEALDDQLETDEEHDPMDMEDGHVPQGARGAGGEADEENHEVQPREGKEPQYTTARFEPMLTPPNTPPITLFAAFIRGHADKQALSIPNTKTKCQPWEYVFHTA